MDVMNRKHISERYYFRTIISMSVIMLLMNNCVGINKPIPGPDPSEFYISGIIYDECGDDELPVEGVKIEITGASFNCSGIVTNEDGQFIIDSNGCSQLNAYLENLKAGAFIDSGFKYPEFTISWDSYELGYDYKYVTWKIKEWDELELSFECDKCDGCCDASTGMNKCEPGEECINHECCEVPPPGFYTTCCNCPLILKPPEASIVSTPTSKETIIVIGECNGCVIDNIIVDGVGKKYGIDNGFFMWDEDERELIIPQKLEIKRKLEVEFNINNQPGARVEFDFIDGGDNEIMALEWNGTEFIKGW